MKYILVLLALLILVGCDSANNVDAARAQYQAASANLSAAIAQEAAIQKATAQAWAAEQSAIKATAGAQDAEIRQIQIEASATMSAIDIQAQQADLMNRQALATRIANDYNLQATAQIQQAQATSTAIYLDMAARSAKVQRSQAGADFWSGFLPMFGGIILVSISILAVILVWYAGKRASLDTLKRDEQIRRDEYTDRFYAARNGTYYLPEGERLPVLVNTLDRIWQLPSGGEQLNTDEEFIDVPVNDEAKPVAPTANDPRFLAMQLLYKSSQAYGWESHDLFGHRQAQMSGRQWTDAIGVITNAVDNHIELRQGEGTRLLRENLQQAYYKISQSPSPDANVGGSVLEQ